MEKTKNKDLPIGRDTENVLKEWLKMYKDLPKTVKYSVYPVIISTISQMISDVYFANALKEALENLEQCKLNSGLTYSNITLKSSVIVVNKTSSFSQLINTIAHEYFHLISHISKILEIHDEEELANLNGNLNMRSYKIIEDLK